MRVRIDTLPPEGETFALELDDAALKAAWGEPPALADWTVSAAAEVWLREGFEAIELGGWARVAYRAPCRWCLQDVAGGVREDLTVRFEAQAAAPPGEELELTENEFGVVEFDGEQIDLGAWLAEQASLMLPEYPACADPARCPGRHAATAAAEHDEIDPRWAGLEALRPGHDKE